MPAEVWVLIGIILTGVFGTVGVIVGHLFSRIAKVEADVLQRNLENHHLWLWARSLVDYGYKWRRPNSPLMPTLEDTITREKERNQR